MIYIKLLKGGDILVIPEEKQAPGIILNSFEYLSFLFKWLYISRMLKSNK
ncbi:Uncharacterised protein [uncultured archaeon]|nr:Uncharacterised protein [uncultured archaeon]